MGPLEDETVATIARLVWRKQNATTFSLASSARAAYSHIIKEIRAPTDTDDLAVAEASNKTADAQAREELGEYYKFVEMGDEVNVHKMLERFEIEERLDGMIDRLLKRLWMLKASKSLSSTAPAPRISGPKAA
jgi:phage gp16-like protein